MGNKPFIDLVDKVNPGGFQCGEWPLVMGHLGLSFIVKKSS